LPRENLAQEELVEEYSVDDSLEGRRDEFFVCFKKPETPFYLLGVTIKNLPANPTRTQPPLNGYGKDYLGTTRYDPTWQPV